MAQFIVHKVIPFLPELSLSPITESSSPAPQRETAAEKQKRIKFSQPSIVLLASTRSLLQACLPYQASVKPVGENLFGVLELTQTICYVRDLELTISLAKTSLKCITAMTFLRKLKLSAVGLRRTLEDRDIAHLDNNNLCLLEELELTTGHRLTDQSLKILGNSTHLQHSLRVLKLRGFTDVTSEGYCALRTLKNLRTFHLCDCFISNGCDGSSGTRRKAEEALSFLGNGNFPFLEELKLENLAGLSLNSISTLPRSLPRLRSLSLASNNGISCEAVSSTLFHCDCSRDLESKALANGNGTVSGGSEDQITSNHVTSQKQKESATNDDNIDDDDDPFPILHLDPATVDEHIWRFVNNLTSLDVGSTDAVINMSISATGPNTTASSTLGPISFLQCLGMFFGEKYLSQVGLRGLNLKVVNLPHGGTTTSNVNLQFNQSFLLRGHTFTPMEWEWLMFGRHFLDRIATPVLTKLDLSHARIGDGVVFLICTSNAVNLTDLDLSKCMDLSDISLQILITHQNNTLKDNYEHFAGYGRYQHPNAQRPVNNNNNATAGRFFPIANSYNSTTEFLFENVTSLRKKSKSFNKRMNDTFLVGCTSQPSFPLRKLNISGCHGFSTAGFRTLHTSMPFLTHLMMTDLLNLGPAAIDEVYHLLLAKSPASSSSSSSVTTKNNDDAKNDKSMNRCPLEFLEIGNWFETSKKEMDQLREFGKNHNSLKLRIVPLGV